jgi:hypothetical protein
VLNSDVYITVRFLRVVNKLNLASIEAFASALSVIGRPGRYTQ